jgi:integrase
MRAVAPVVLRMEGLDAPTKSRLPISVAIDASGNHVVISRYEDKIWNFWPYNNRENMKDGGMRINWSITFADGTQLTDDKHSVLMTSSKDFIWSLYADPVEGMTRPAMKTIITHSVSLIFLLRWMVNNNICRFADLRGRTMDYVNAAKNDTSVVKSTLMKRLVIVEKLYAQAGKINDFLPEHPWPFESAALLAGVDQRMSHRVPLTSVIPDDLFVKLAKHAIEYVDERASDILAVHEEVMEAIKAARIKRMSHAYSFTFGTEVARSYGYDGVRELNREVGYLRIACYICINMFSGLRNSEMMSLETNCISRSPGIDGSYECIWLHGTIYKTGERPHKWLVPPIVERAVRVAMRLVEPYQKQLAAEITALKKSFAGRTSTATVPQQKRLAYAERNKRKLFLTAHYGEDGVLLSVPSNGAVNLRLKDFCERCGLIDSKGEVWPLASHQFRRTFAYNYARSELGDLLYLKEHYGHWSLEMTVSYADGGADGYQVDNGLLEDVVQAKQKRQAEILAGYLDSDQPLANGQDWMMTWRPMIRTAKNKEELIRELSGTITLNGTGHSWCAGNAQGGSCGGLCVFEADMCVDCNTALIGPEHLPVWREIAVQQQVVLGLPDMGVPAKARARRILDKAIQVIAKLEVSVGASA